MSPLLALLLLPLAAPSRAVPAAPRIPVFERVPLPPETDDRPRVSVAAATPATAECVPFLPTGCLYLPEGRASTLLIFFRGWRQGFAGHVTGDDNVLAAARAAFDDLEVGRVAAALGAAALVTGSSDLVVGDAQVAAVERKAGHRFRRLWLAAHSGGYVGLDGALGGALSRGRVARVVALDDFYDQGAGIPLLKGLRCAGFYTPQSKRYERQALDYRQVCAVEKRTDFDGDSHERVVNLCLESYLSGRACPPRP